MNQNLKLYPQYRKSFLTAGKALFTLHNTKTNNHFTYKVVRAKGVQNFYFVSVFNGTNNDSHYKYIGTLNDLSNLYFKYGKKAKIERGTQSVVVFEWFIKNFNKLPENVEMLHSNKCGRCGRTLTHPESITNGIGPECIKHIKF